MGHVMMPAACRLLLRALGLYPWRAIRADAMMAAQAISTACGFTSSLLLHCQPRLLADRIA